MTACSKDTSKSTELKSGVRMDKKDIWRHFSFFIKYNYRKENLIVVHELELCYDLFILRSVLVLTI